MHIHARFILDLYAVSIVVALPMFLMTFWIPRSKRWLLLHGLRDEALESMRFIYRGDHVEDEFQKLVEQLELARKSSMTATTKNHDQDENHPMTITNADATINTAPSLWDPKYRPAMIASMGLIAFQQFSGQPSVLSYTTVLFQEAGWSGNASVVTSILMMCASMTTVALVDRVGRKVLLLTCCGVMITSLIALSSCFWHNEQQQQHADSVPFTSIQQIVILIAMFIYIGGFQIGFGPITWCIVSEVFPLEIRGQAIALGVELNYLLNFLVQFMFPIIQDTLGWGPSFALFGGLLMVCVGFIQSRVPETKGLTLEEIQIQLSSRQEDARSHEGSPLLSTFTTESV
jgi:MFS family permease